MRPADDTGGPGRSACGVARRDWQGKENLLLDQFCKIKRPCQGQEIQSLILQFFRSDAGINLLHEFQKALDYQGFLHRFQTTLADKRQDAPHFETQTRLSVLARYAFKDKGNFAFPMRKQIVKAREGPQTQNAFQAPGFTAETTGINHGRLRHGKRMILFLPREVKVQQGKRTVLADGNEKPFRNKGRSLSSTLGASVMEKELHCRPPGQRFFLHDSSHIGTEEKV
jgi:hypothetical protein